jgi:hypothetical protein
MTRGAWIAVGTSVTLAFVLAIVLIVVIAVDGDGPDAAAEAGTEVTPQAGPQMIGPMGGGMPPEAQACLDEKGITPPGATGEIPDEAEIERLREALEECGLPAPRIVTPGS